MRRALAQRAAWVIAGGMASTASGPVLGGCGGSNPSEGGSADGGGKDSTTGDGAESRLDSSLGPEDFGPDGARVEAGGDDRVVNGMGGGESGACAPNTQRCVGSSVETCGASGQWGSAWPCATGVCASGACAGATAPGASCQAGGAGLTDCGASAESCCTRLEVPGGIFHRTYTNTGNGPMLDGGDGDPASVSGFRLDKYLVTVGRFRQFVGAWNGGYRPAEGSGKHTHLNGGSGLNATTGGYEPGWVVADAANVAPTDANLTAGGAFSTWTGGNENRPMNCMNWWESYAFCIWDGGFLPSESELGYAAAGGSEEREYPWGTATPGTSNQYAIYNCNYPSGGSGTCTDVSAMAPVGTAALGAGRWGQLDLAGEVWEWDLDWIGENYTYANPCADCTVSIASAMVILNGAMRVIRGGGFGAPGSDALLSSRHVGYPPDVRANGFGFRCAWPP